MPFKYNIVYIEVLKGDFFGEIDFVVAARENDISVEEIIDRINIAKINLVRQFTIQAIEDSVFLTMTISNLQRMQK